MFILAYTNVDDNTKRFNARKYYLPKDVIKNFNAIINQKNFYDQAIDSGIKRYKEIRKLATDQGEGYTTGCLLGYDYIKNHYRLIVADLSRQKELDAHSKAIPQTEFVRKFKKLADNGNATDADNNLSILTILENIKEKSLKFCQGSVALLSKMVKYQEARVKLPNTQLNN